MERETAAEKSKALGKHPKQRPDRAVKLEHANLVPPATAPGPKFDDSFGIRRAQASCRRLDPIHQSLASGLKKRFGLRPARHELPQASANPPRPDLRMIT
eukprot:6171442-Alexandrium_andersonii.AAC.1